MERKIKAEIYSRVVGYFRPVDQWNPGKREEFESREVLKFDSEFTSASEEVTSEAEALVI